MGCHCVHWGTRLVSSRYRTKQAAVGTDVVMHCPATPLGSSSALCMMKKPLAPCLLRDLQRQLPHQRGWQPQQHYIRTRWFALVEPYCAVVGYGCSYNGPGWLKLGVPHADAMSQMFLPMCSCQQVTLVSCDGYEIMSIVIYR